MAVFFVVSSKLYFLNTASKTRLEYDQNLCAILTVSFMRIALYPILDSWHCPEC